MMSHSQRRNGLPVKEALIEAIKISLFFIIVAISQQKPYYRVYVRDVDVSMGS